MLSNLLVSLVASLSLVVQAPETPSKQAQVRVLERVAVVGASVSAGYHAETRFAEVFTASLTTPPKAPLADAATEMLFLTMGAGATKQLTRVQKSEPTLIVGIDLPFWFGYGNLDFEGQPLGDEAARLALLERGLEFLATIETPLVIADFPDMSPAVGRMLMPNQMPTAETLAKLNQRLGEWAKTRPNVVLIPLSQWILDLRSQKPITLGAATFAPEVTATWMQTDGLHPTVAGLAALTALIHSELIARKLVDASEVITDPALILERVVAAKAAEAAAPVKKD